MNFTTIFTTIWKETTHRDVSVREEIIHLYPGWGSLGDAGWTSHSLDDCFLQCKLGVWGHPPVPLGRRRCHVGKPDGVGKGRPTFRRSCLGNQTLHVLFWLIEHHACSLLQGKMPSTLSNHKSKTWGFPGGSMVRNLPADAGDAGLIPGPERPYVLRSN